MAKPQLGDLDLELDVLTWSEVISMSVQLRMEFADLRKIDESTSPSIRVLTAMDLWLKTDTKASWKKVVRALRAIKKDVLAQTLEERYCRATPAPPPPSGSGAVILTAPRSVVRPLLRRLPIPMLLLPRPLQVSIGSYIELQHFGRAIKGSPSPPPIFVSLASHNR